MADKRRIWLRADASTQIGYGHFVRMLALGEMLKESFELVFATRNPTAHQIEQIEALCDRLVVLDDAHFDEFLTLVEQSDIVVLDNYFFNTNYQQKIKDKGCRLVCVDDVHDRHYVADAVVNQILGVEATDFSCAPSTRLCLGANYAMLRAPFRAAMGGQRLRPNTANRLLVAMGGSDPKQITERIVGLIKEQYEGQISVLIGGQYKGADRLTRYRGVEVHQNLDAQGCADLIAAQDVVVVPSSTLSYESFAIGCAVVVGYYTTNQIEAQRHMATQGLAIGCGDFETISSAEMLRKIAEARSNAQKLIDRQKVLFDGKQAERFIELMEYLWT